MPYIKQEDRINLSNIAKDLHSELIRLSDGVPEYNFRHIAGNLNFFISTVINELLKYDKSYARINELIGALECAKLEIYRKLAAPYEDTKIKTNGEVFDQI